MKPNWQKEIGAMVPLLVADLGRATQCKEEVFGLPVQHEDADSVMFRFTNRYVFLHKAAGARRASPRRVPSPRPRADRRPASSRSSSKTSMPSAQT